MGVLIFLDYGNSFGLWEQFHNTNFKLLEFEGFKKRAGDNAFTLDIEKALDPEVDRVDAIVSVPETRMITSNFGNLTLTEYKKYADDLTAGFVEAEKILEEERIFSSKDLPYTTQFIPLAVLCTLLAEGNMIKVANIKNKIKQWYWCGVFGEMYGGANETRYVYDAVGVMDWVADDTKIPRTVQESYFNPTRLLGLQSRLSAAYKGIMALVLKNHCQDFISGREMDFTIYKAENIDIHHIFPRAYCESQRYDKTLWNSVVNKTPITYSTNREIGGVAPSVYLSKIESKGQVAGDELDKYVSTHWIDVSCCRSDDFHGHIINRAKMLLAAIENATGKTIAGKESEEVISSFGDALI